MRTSAEVGGAAQRLLKRTTQWMSDLAAVAILAIIVVTIADVAMKNAVGLPIRGAFELVELLLVIVVFFGLPEVFRSESNICVDVIDHAVGPRGRSRLQVFGALASLGFLLLLMWAMIAPALDTVRYPQWTQELGLPLYAQWAVILFGAAITIVAAIGAGAARLRSRGEPA